LLTGPAFPFAGGEPAAGPPPPPEPKLSPLAVEVNSLLSRLGKKPDSKQLQTQFLGLFEQVYNREIAGESPEDSTTFGAAFTKAYQLARRGNKPFLRALMLASLGPYGRTAEGDEWINEMLWENLEAQTQLTVDTLAELPAGARSRIVESEYLHPIHAGFDFRAIRAGLESARVPASIRADVARIIEVAGRSVSD
jgi:hypothetical protein